jgi:hypothetical protein
MKTNTAARRIRKIRTILSVLAIAAITTFDLGVGYYCVSNCSKTPVSSNTTPPGCNLNVSVGDVFLAAR